jgi:hypothetical protein
VTFATAPPPRSRYWEYSPANGFVPMPFLNISSDEDRCIFRRCRNADHCDMVDSCGVTIHELDVLRAPLEAAEYEILRFVCFSGGGRPDMMTSDLILRPASSRGNRRAGAEKRNREPEAAMKRPGRRNSWPSGARPIGSRSASGGARGGMP